VRRTRGAVKRGAEEGGWDEEEKEQEEQEEVHAMVGVVVRDLSAELYIELLTGFD
jgi:hypothetical protein